MINRRHQKALNFLDDHPIFKEMFNIELLKDFAARHADSCVTLE